MGDKHYYATLVPIMMSTFYANSSWGNGFPFGPSWFMGIGALGLTFIFAFVIAVIALKGYTLWHASKRNERGWFVALLVINTFGILELIYLIFIMKKWSKDNTPRHHESHDGHHHTQ